MKIGIVGYGYVGKATERMLPKNYEVIVKDPKIGFKDLENKISDCDIIFVAINETDVSMSNLFQLVDELIKNNTKGIIVIRTTVLPGTIDKLTQRYSRTFVYMPEFLREWNYEYDSEHPDKIVIGTEDKETFDKLRKLFAHKNAPIIQVKPVEAELAKLSLNALGMIKVVFAEELYNLATTLEADYQSIYRIFELDRNVNVRHLIPNKDGYRGADGKCLPKDTYFLIQSGIDNNSRMLLLETAKMINDFMLRLGEINREERK